MWGHCGESVKHRSPEPHKNTQTLSKSKNGARTWGGRITQDLMNAEVDQKQFENNTINIVLQMQRAADSKIRPVHPLHSRQGSGEVHR